MPRSASQSPDDALQGNLFGAPEPAAPMAAAPASEPETASQDLSDDELGADAAARPRTRQATSGETISESQATSYSEVSSDAPAWACLLYTSDAADE